RKIRKGLEPLIAAIILIAITIVIAIAVAAWVLGVFGTSVGGSEQLVVLPNATLNGSSTTWTLKFTVYNKGSTVSEITGVAISNCSVTTITPSLSQTQTLTVGPGETKTFTAQLSSCSLSPGVTYQVKVYTKAGNVYFTTVVAGSG
ncbi:MAG TPA: archaellin/type IV pilin N-terminal domain-containing protein, partial [Sulfolobales archaeon]|nr:archaellin/type IV pilin N-terminal domain-containing protein [Sulfolobales archaeon]